MATKDGTPSVGGRREWRGRRVAVLVGVGAVVVGAALAVDQRDDLVAWYQFKRMAGTWVFDRVEAIDPHPGFRILTPLGHEFDVTSDGIKEHHTYTSTGEDFPRTLASIEDGMLKLYYNETHTEEFAFGYSVSGGLYLETVGSRCH